MEGLTFFTHKRDLILTYSHSMGFPFSQFFEDFLHLHPYINNVQSQVNNYIVRLYRVVIVATNIVTRRTNKA